MSSPFSSMELQLIRSSLSTRTDEDLAELLERPIEDVRIAIDQITGGMSKERNLDAIRYQEEKAIEAQKKKPGKVNKLPTKKEKENRHQELIRQRDDKNRRRINDMESARKKEQAGRSMNRVRQTKKIDYTQMKHVRVSRNTWICVPKSTSDKDAIELYNQGRDNRSQSVKDIESKLHNS